METNPNGSISSQFLVKLQGDAISEPYTFVFHIEDAVGEDQDFNVKHTHSS
jgi:hypothetical protein